MQDAPLVAAIVGNGRMLGNIDSRGELMQLFWPHIDHPNHVQRVNAGVQIVGWPGVKWLSDDSWSFRQRYTGVAPILETVAENAGRGLSVTLTDFITPFADTLVRRYQWHNNGIQAVDLIFMFYAAFHLSESRLYNSVFWEPQAGALVYYRRDVWLAIGGARAPAGYRVGPRPYEGSAWNDAQDGHLSGGVIEMNDVDGALAWQSGALQPGGTWQTTVYISLGSSKQKALTALAAARGQGAGALEKAAVEAWDDWLRQSDACCSRTTAQTPGHGHAAAKTRISARLATGFTGSSPALGEETADDISTQTTSLPLAEANETTLTPASVRERLWQRSLVVMRLMADDTGGIIAAPEFDPNRQWCGGYGYCWGRDAAYIVHALDVAGRHDMAAAFYKWAARVQEPSGVWYQRYWVTGEVGPSWGLIQIDETGSILWGLWQHIEMTGNDQLLRDLWPCIEKGAGFLIRFRDPETGLLQASWDLWEERYGIHTYSCAAVYGGLSGAARLAHRLGQAEQAQVWQGVADELQAAVMEHCWSGLHNRFLRSINLRVPEWTRHDRVLGGRVRELPPPPGHLYPEYAIPDDATVDASLLGLAVPFALCRPDDPRIVTTVEAIERDLMRSPAGGVMRYAGDHYRGGNPWVLCTLWLAQYYIVTNKRSKAEQLLDWAETHCTALDLLPEQVDRNTGAPAWVVPLTWSHAMYILTVAMLRQAGAPA